MQIFAGLPADDWVIHAGGTVDEVERGMETLIGKPQLCMRG